jgi:carboxylesterase type B
VKVEHERCDFLQHFGGNNQQVLMFGESSGGTVSKNGLFEPFSYKNEHFTKTGSGQI